MKYRIGLLINGTELAAALVAVRGRDRVLHDYVNLTLGADQPIHWPRRYHATAGLSDEQVIVKMLSLDKRCQSPEIYQYLQRNCEQLFHLPAEQLHLDFMIVGQPGNELHMIVACACKKNVVAALVQQCKTVGLTLQAVDYQPFAWLRALQWCSLTLENKHALICKQSSHYLCVAKTPDQLWVQKEDHHHYPAIEEALQKLGVTQYWNLNEKYLPFDMQLQTAINPTLEQFTCLGLAAWSKHQWP